MDIGTISMRYAKALLKYAKTTGTEAYFYGVAKQWVDSFGKHSDLHQSLINPILTQRQKYSLICTAGVGAQNVRRELSRFISLILKNTREEFLLYISYSYIDLYRKENHIVLARLTTASPIDAQLETKIRNSAGERLHATMELETLVDENIIGGFIVDIENHRLDASIASQLKTVKKQFIDKNKRIV